MFKALQWETGHTVEFQENAAAESSEFLQSYHYAITTLFEKKALHIAGQYEIPGYRLSDPELFAEVIETVHQEEKKIADEAQAVVACELHGLFGPLFGNCRAAAAGANSAYTDEVASIISRLQEISDRKPRSLLRGGFNL